MKKLTHQFVERLPQPLEEGVIYVSIRFRLVAHNCCCGCGRQVVTNLDPEGWILSFDGRAVSLSPSIGNWDFPCRSHYFITKNTVQWAEFWSDAQVRRAKLREADGGIVESKGRPPKERGGGFLKGLWDWRPKKD